MIQESTSLAHEGRNKTSGFSGDFRFDAEMEAHLREPRDQEECAGGESILEGMQETLHPKP